VLQISLQHQCIAEKSATRMHLVQNPQIPTLGPATWMQRQKICNTDALQSLKLARKLQELAQKFPYKSTYMLPQWDKKTKFNLVISQQTHGASESQKRTLTCFPHKPQQKYSTNECIRICRPFGRCHL
jgi:hypothetical protein